MSKQICANTVAICNMIKALEGGATVADIVQESGLHEVTVRRWVRQFHSSGMVHVIGHELSGKRRTMRVWSWGAGRDAKYQPKSSTQRWHQHMGRKQDRQILAALHGQR